MILKYKGHGNKSEIEKFFDSHFPWTRNLDSQRYYYSLSYNMIPQVVWKMVYEYLDFSQDPVIYVSLQPLENNRLCMVIGYNGKKFDIKELLMVENSNSRIFYKGSFRLKKAYRTGLIETIKPVHPSIYTNMFEVIFNLEKDEAFKEFEKNVNVKHEYIDTTFYIIDEDSVNALFKWFWNALVYLGYVEDSEKPYQPMALEAYIIFQELVLNAIQHGFSRFAEQEIEFMIKIDSPEEVYLCIPKGRIIDQSVEYEEIDGKICAVYKYEPIIKEDKQGIKRLLGIKEVIDEEVVATYDNVDEKDYLDLMNDYLINSTKELGFDIFKQDDRK